MCLCMCVYVIYIYIYIYILERRIKTCIQIGDRKLYIEEGIEVNLFVS